MALDLTKIQKSFASAAQIDPRKIFTTLPRQPRFKRPSDEQADVLDLCFKNRDRKNNTIKMNTGAGKTVVGLLALQSSLNAGVFPAIYVSPDNYLVEQTVREAKDLGIVVTQDENDPAFLSGKSILIINIWKLVNGRSAFGVGEVRIPINAVVIDDAHACLTTVAEQFKLRIPCGHDVFVGLLTLFKEDLRYQSPTGLLEIESGDPNSIMAVPFWSWKDRQGDVLKLLHEHRNDEAIKFAWPLIKDVFHLSQCVFGGRELEIAPRFLPIDIIPSFTRARRRIYMTATLADDGILVSHFQADPDEIADTIRPKGAGDIGDRMILAPQEINTSVLVDEIKAFAGYYAKYINVVVIVPSDKRGKYWGDIAQQSLTRANIGEGVERLKAGHIGLTILVNKYDGVDLPNNACRMLVIDGLPETYGLIERVEMATLEGTEGQLLRQIQKLEQGMGRGVRASEDYCVVLLLGARLTQRIHLREARDKFTSATRAQLDLGREITSQVQGQPLAEVANIVNLCLNQDPAWVTTSRGAIAAAPDARPGFIEPTLRHLRAAFDHARISRYDLAEKEVQAAVQATTERVLQGYYKMQLAEYVHHQSPVRAQEILLSAATLNRRLVRPIAGITYTKLSAPQGTQARAATAAMSRFLEPNDLIVWLNSLLEDMDWDPEKTSRFESAIRDLGTFLGFGSQRPEKEIGKGPDNLWAVGNLRYFVIECKSGVTNTQIAKSDCNQLIGSISWFGTAYDNTCQAVPVLVHPVIQFDRYSSPAPDTRIVESASLQTLKDALRSYGAALAANRAYQNETEVAKHLGHFKLTGSAFLPAYSKNFTVAKS